MNNEYFAVAIAAVYSKVLSPEETNERLIEIVRQIREDERAKIQRSAGQVEYIGSEVLPQRLLKREAEKFRPDEIRLIDSNAAKFDRPDQIEEL